MTNVLENFAVCFGLYFISMASIFAVKTQENQCAEYYFWRTTQQQEIDLIKVLDAKVEAIEIKYNPKQKAKFSKTFINNYQPVALITINSDNFLGFYRLDF